MWWKQIVGDYVLKWDDNDDDKDVTEKQDVGSIVIWLVHYEQWTVWCG